MICRIKEGFEEWYLETHMKKSNLLRNHMWVLLVTDTLPPLNGLVGVTKVGDGLNVTFVPFWLLTREEE